MTWADSVVAAVVETFEGGTPPPHPPSNVSALARFQAMDHSGMLQFFEGMRPQAPHSSRQPPPTLLLNSARPSYGRGRVEYGDGNCLEDYMAKGDAGCRSQAQGACRSTVDGRR